MLFELRETDFYYKLGQQRIPALKNLTLNIDKGEFVCLCGPSGSGKTTLLNLLGLIESPQKANQLYFDSKDVHHLHMNELNEIRAFKLGFVFQQFLLMPVLSAMENVAYFLRKHKLSKEQINQRVEEALSEVGLWELRHKKPLEMSGGQRQRVAIARSFAKKPQIIIADEPTASLDQQTGEEIMQVFEKLNSKHSVSIILSSHDPMVLERCPKKIRLVDGALA